MITILFYYESMERLSIFSTDNHVVVPRKGEHIIIEFFKYRVEDVTHKFEKLESGIINQEISVELSRLM